MRGKVARQLRKILDIKKPYLRGETKAMQVGGKQVAIIDGVNGDHRVEERPCYQLFSDETYRLYRQLKRAYTQNLSIKQEIVDDITHASATKGGTNE